jgi:hypothetical protein
MLNGAFLKLFSKHSFPLYKCKSKKLSSGLNKGGYVLEKISNTYSKSSAKFVYRPEIIFKNSVRASKRTKHFTITKIKG